MLNCYLIPGLGALQVDQTSSHGVGELLGHGLNWWLSTCWRDVAGPGSTGTLFAPVLSRWPEEVGPGWNHLVFIYRPVTERWVSFQPGLHPWKELCISREPLTSWMNFILFFLYVAIGLPVSILPGTTRSISKAPLLLCEQSTWV